MTMASTQELAANRRDIRPGRIITWTLLLIGGIIMITPLLFMFSTSLKTSGQVYDLKLIPSAPTLDNYIKVLGDGRFMQWFLNSTIIAVTVTLSNVAVSDPTAALSAGCSAAALAPQESIACTATHTATQADLTAGSYTNTASATGKSPSGTAVPVAQASATVNATLTGGITLSETVTPATYSDSGQTLTFTIAARNTPPNA